MTFTGWQTGKLWVNDWRSAAVELLAPLRLWYRHIEIHLEDGGPVPWSYCERLRSVGYTVSGCFWADTADPVGQAIWSVAEAKRLVLWSIDCNAEDAIEEEDSRRRAAGQPTWSAQYCQEFRKLAPGRGLALNTFSGCGYLDHAAWRKASARLYLQTFPGSLYGFSENVSYLVGKAAEWGWGKARVKPCLGVYKFNGVRPPPEDMVASAKVAGTKGFSAYYADGAFDDENYLKSLGQQALAAGIAY